MGNYIILLTLLLITPKSLYSKDILLPPPNLKDSTSIDEIPSPTTLNKSQINLNIGITGAGKNEETYFTTGWNFSIGNEFYINQYLSIGLEIDFISYRRNPEYDITESYLFGGGGGIDLFFHIPIVYNSQAVVIAIKEKVWITRKILLDFFTVEGGYEWLNGMIRVCAGVGGLAQWDVTEHDNEYYENSGYIAFILHLNLTVGFVSIFP